MKRINITLMMIAAYLNHTASGASSSLDVMPASSGIVEQRLKQRYLDTVYPPLTDAFPARALIAASTTKKRDALIPAAAAGFGYGAGRIISTYLKSSRPDLAAFITALATTTVSAGIISLTKQAAEEPTVETPEESIDPETIKQEQAALKSLLPELNFLLGETIIEQDKLYAKQKFELQWLTVAHEYESWVDTHPEETLIDASEQAPLKKLSDFYPDELKPFTTAHHPSNIVNIDEVEFVEIDTQEPDYVDLDAVIETYTQKAAVYRKRQAHKNAQAIMERLAQLTGHAHRTNPA